MHKVSTAFHSQCEFSSYPARGGRADGIFKCTIKRRHSTVVFMYIASIEIGIS